MSIKGLCGKGVVLMRSVLKILGIVGFVLIIFGSGAFTTAYFLNSRVLNIRKTMDIMTVMWCYKTLQALEAENVQQAYELQEKRLRLTLQMLSYSNVDESDEEFIQEVLVWLESRK